MNECYSKGRTFSIWAICLLIVVVTVSILFVAHVASSPSEPFVSVKIDNTTNKFGTDIKAISIQLSNRMSLPAKRPEWIIFKATVRLRLICRSSRGRIALNGSGRAVSNFSR